MNWKKHIMDLEAGNTVQCRPKGNSMSPKINSGNKITISPSKSFKKGDMVFCKVKGRYYIHLISAVNGQRYQISNNKGKINAWIHKKNIFGKVIKIEK